jgi:hypothetical protein
MGDPMSRKTAAKIALCAAVALLAAAPGANAGTLDQSQTAHNAVRNAGGNGVALAQTFTAGRSGQLDQVDIELSKCTTGPGLRVDLFLSAPGDPVNGERQIASTPLPDSSVPEPEFQFLSIPVVPPVTVAAGTQYTIAVIANSYFPFCVGGFPPYEWGASTGNPYPGGAAWYLPGEGGGLEWIEEPDLDLAFRTFVTDPPSPQSTQSTQPTSRRASAIRKCKKKLPKGKRRKKCIRRAKKLPV